MITTFAEGHRKNFPGQVRAYVAACNPGACASQVADDRRRAMEHPHQLQWRICFHFVGEDALNVQIVDYH
jgi:hypothetical protein